MQKIIEISDVLIFDVLIFNNIYVNRGEGDLVFVGNDAKLLYNDPTSLPAEPNNWVYKAIYLVNGKD